MNGSNAQPHPHEPARAIWHKASAGGPEHDCVEVAALPCGSTAVRDSKRPDAAQLRWGPTAWAAFTRGVAAGDL